MKLSACKCIQNGKSKKVQSSRLCEMEKREMNKSLDNTERLGEIKKKQQERRSKANNTDMKQNS